MRCNTFCGATKKPSDECTPIPALAPIHPLAGNRDYLMNRGRMKIVSAALVLFAFGFLVLSLVFKIFPLLIATAISLCASVGVICNRLAKSSLLISSVLSAVLLGEMVAFLSDRSTLRPAVVVRPADFEVADANLGYLWKPGRHRVKAYSRSGQVMYDVVYSIGDDGFRFTPDVTGTEPVYFLGASDLFGTGVNDDETLPFLFRRVAPQSFVKNYGGEGYGLSHNLVVLRDRIMERKAIVIVLTGPWYAPRSACLGSWLYGSPRFIIDDHGTVIEDGICDNLFIRAYNIGLESKFMLYRKLLSLIELQLRSDKRVLDLYLATLGELKRVADSRSQRLLVAYTKVPEGYLGPWNVSNETIMAAIQQMGIELIDVTLMPTFEALTDEYFVHQEDSHPSVLANDLRAKVLAKYLRANRARSGIDVIK